MVVSHKSKRSVMLITTMLMFIMVVTTMMTMTVMPVKASVIQGDLTITSLCPNESGPFNLTAIGWSVTQSDDETLTFRYRCAVGDRSEKEISSFITETQYVYAPNEIPDAHCSLDVMSSNFTDEEEPITVSQNFDVQQPMDMETFQCLFDKFSVVPVDQQPTHILYIAESIVDVSTEYFSNGQKEQLVGMVLSELENNSNLKADNATVAIDILLYGLYELTLETYANMTVALTRALNSGDFTELELAKYSAQQLCDWLITPESTLEQRQVVDALVTALMMRLREKLEIDDTAEFSTQAYKVSVSRVIPDPTMEPIEFDFRRPEPARSLNSIDDYYITVIVDRKNLESIPDSSIYAQASAVAYPTNSYETKCDSEMVSPSVSVQLFSLSQNEIALPPVVNSPLFDTRLSPSEQLKSKSFNYTCRFFDTTSMAWSSDQQVCKTQVGEVHDKDYPPEVTCSCIQPTQVGVSLDYVQSSSSSESSDSKCDNPCGCKSKKNGWAPWKTALLVLGLLTIVLIIAALIGVVAIVVVLQLRKGGEAQ